MVLCVCVGLEVNRPHVLLGTLCTCVVLPRGNTWCDYVCVGLEVNRPHVLLGTLCTCVVLPRGNTWCYVCV